jgi:hypothetical protein
MKDISKSDSTHLSWHSKLGTPPEMEAYVLNSDDASANSVLICIPHSKPLV